VTKLTRRTLIQSATIFAGTAAANLLPAKKVNATPPPDACATKGPTIIASDETNIVETSAGKVRGYTHIGIHTFKGIPYGASTEGSARFMAPTKPKPWTGVRSSMQYGWVSPQAARGGWADDENAWLFNWNDGIQNEDCLRLNIWTPSINDNAKRPVMVWLHGGGFVAGNGQEHPAYDGESLARSGDVVLVSLNHRLGAVGHLDLSQFGEKFRDSGNVGMMDIVLALEWVRDNIGRFGGDSGNVTVFGQSGGGGKVNTLLAMPSAKGLFHRGIVQSGSMLRGGTPERSAKLSAAIVAELNVKPDDLQTIPYRQLVDVSMAIIAKNRPTGPPDVRRMADQLGFAPVVDGRILPVHPYRIRSDDRRRSRQARHNFLRRGSRPGNFENFQRTASRRKTVRHLFPHDGRVRPPGRRHTMRTQSRPRRRSRIQLLVPVENSGSRRAPPRISLRRNRLLLQQHLSRRNHDHQQPRSPIPRRKSLRRLGRLRPHRQPQPPRPSHMAEILSRQMPHHDLQQPVRGQRQPRHNRTQSHRRRQSLAARRRTT
jgi:carboxylesterase type B